MRSGIFSYSRNIANFLILIYNSTYANISIILSSESDTNMLPPPLQPPRPEGSMSIFVCLSKSPDSSVSRVSPLLLLTKMWNSLACGAGFRTIARSSASSWCSFSIRVARRRIYSAIQKEFQCSRASPTRRWPVSSFLLGLASLIIRRCPPSLSLPLLFSHFSPFLRDCPPLKYTFVLRTWCEARDPFRRLYYPSILNRITQPAPFSVKYVAPWRGVIYSPSLTCEKYTRECAIWM